VKTTADRRAVTVQESRGDVALEQHLRDPGSELGRKNVKPTAGQQLHERIRQGGDYGEMLAQMTGTPARPDNVLDRTLAAVTKPSENAPANRGGLTGRLQGGLREAALGEVRKLEVDAREAAENLSDFDKAVLKERRLSNTELAQAEAALKAGEHELPAADARTYAQAIDQVQADRVLAGAQKET
jgi:hypothetical protein